MLNKPVEEIVYDANGVACGVKSEGQVAKCKFVVGDPTYFSNKVKKVGEVAYCICILSGPVPNTNNAESCQIIIPQKEVKRKFGSFYFFINQKIFTFLLSLLLTTWLLKENGLLLYLPSLKLASLKLNLLLL